MYTDVTPAITTPEEVLDGVAGVREQVRLLDRGLVVLAVEWAKHNPGNPRPADHPGFEGGEDQWAFDQMHAQGCLSFDDTAVTDFAVAAGLTEYTARKLIRESLMLVHLLPRVWSRVLRGGVDVWRARLLADDCFGLTTEAIDHIDAHMADQGTRITVNSRERIISEARKLYMEDEEKDAEESAKEQRRVEILKHQQAQGVLCVFAQLDLPDALALDAALSAGAKALKELGSDAPLDTRRAWALGDLARAATGGSTLLHPAPDSSAPAEPRPHWNGLGAEGPQVKLFVHLPSNTFAFPAGPSLVDPSAPLARVQGTGLMGSSIFNPTTIQEWFTRPTTAGPFTQNIQVRPVLDLEEEKNTDAYSPPPRTKEHTHLTHGECVFPFCTRPSFRCDLDHTEPWRADGSGGATCTCNLAPLCRRHHRLKTHGDNAPVTSGKHNSWTYVHLGGQEYYWHGPRNMHFIRTPVGTFNAHPDTDSGAPRHPGVLGGRCLQPDIDLGDDAVRTEVDTLVDRLLSKASMTRGVHNRDYSPMWTMPETSSSDDPPDDYPTDDDTGGSIEFYVPYEPPEGSPVWEFLNSAPAVS